jgi:hypothetical protein
MKTLLIRVLRFGFRITNKFLNKFGILLSKPGTIHGSPAFSGATLWARRLNQMKIYFDLVEGVEGDILESGVHWGYGILIELVLGGKNRKVFGFDSFSGHSKPHLNDYSGGDYAPLDNSFKISENDVWKTLQLGTGKKELELKSRVTLISGWIQETLPVFREKAKSQNIKLALVHCDCDIYEPFKATLENSWDLLSDNGIIILGLLNNPELMGKTQAVNDVLDKLNVKEYELGSIDVIDTGGKLVSESYLKKLSTKS